MSLAATVSRLGDLARLARDHIEAAGACTPRILSALDACEEAVRLSEASQTASHAPCRAEAAADGAEQCSAATGEAQRHVRGVWLVPPTASAQERAELAREGAEVRDGWWLTVAVWTAGDVA